LRKDWTISVIAHVAAVSVGFVSFTTKPPASDATDWMPISIVSDSDASQMTRGEKNAKPAETPKPLVEKVAELPKPVEDTSVKVAEKEVKAARETPSEPPTPPQPVEKPKPEVKPDPIAETLAKEEKRPEPKQAAKTPTPPKKPTPPAPKYDPKQIETLLNKRDATRLAAAGDVPNQAPSLGLPTATAAQMSQNELQALISRLAQLWMPPAGAKNPDELVVKVRIQLRKDGTLSGPPMVLTSGSSPLFNASRDSAIRAVFRGQPYDMLKPEHYEQWKDIEINFDPRDMIRG
jgi:outer membrane biosynthesis protein TonB